MALLAPSAARRHGSIADRIGNAVNRCLEVCFAAGRAEPGSHRRVAWLLIPGMLYVLGEMMSAFAQVAKAPEYSLKAAYLFNFAQFVEWPSSRFTSEDAPIVIGVLGDDPFGGALDQVVKEKKVHGRAFEIKRSKQIGDLSGCHVLFVCASEAKRLSDILPTIKKAGLLTVSDIERFAELGGVINFTMENNKIRFDVNMNSAAAAGLKISSQLLRLARKVWRLEEVKP